MATNAAYCKTYRKRTYNFEDRVQQTATPTPPLQHDSNVNADAEMMKIIKFMISLIKWTM